MKKFLKYILYTITLILILSCSFIGYLTITEYKPKEIENLQLNKTEINTQFEIEKEYKALNWNIGFAGMDKDIDFFMDGGTMSLPIDREHVENNLTNIIKFIKNQNADINFLQEVDENSKRSYNINQVEKFNYELQQNSTFAYNYKVEYVPYPLNSNPLGKMASGIYTSSKYEITDATRHQLPIPFKYPVRIANLKRAISVNYANIKNSDKKLVLINAHLDAYDSNNEGKIAQTKFIVDFINNEYNKGNYIILGADFNQELGENSTSVPEHLWQPTLFEKSLLGNNFKVYYDTTSPTARLNNKPYIKNSEGTYTFVIDGYIVSNNINVSEVKTIDLDFQNSDHNPVILKFELKN